MERIAEKSRAIGFVFPCALASLTVAALVGALSLTVLVCIIISLAVVIIRDGAGTARA